MGRSSVAVPACFVGRAAGPIIAQLVAMAYFVISSVILSVFYPKVMGDAVKLPPVLIIVAFIAGFTWAGILAMFVARPHAATPPIPFFPPSPHHHPQPPLNYRNFTPPPPTTTPTSPVVPSVRPPP